MLEYETEICLGKDIGYDVTLNIDYHISPEEKQTLYHPHYPAEVEILSIEVSNVIHGSEPVTLPDAVLNWIANEFEDLFYMRGEKEQLGQRFHDEIVELCFKDAREY